MDVRRMRPEDSEADAELLRASFLLPPHRLASYEATPPEDGWVVAAEDRILAGLKAERLTQVVGRQSVRAAAVFGVKVAAECRGRGLGRALLSQMLHDLRDEGVDLVTLYPTDPGAYQGAGFELAGACMRYEVRSDRLPHSSAGIVERLTEPDIDLLDPAYRSFALAETGLLGRTQRWWSARVLVQGELGAPQCFVVPGDNGVQGYVLLDRSPVRDSPHFRSTCRDLVWHDVNALSALMATLSALRAVSPAVTWTGPAVDPIIMGLGFPAVRIVDRRLWMTRILDPQRALCARGYPASLEGCVSLAVEDPLFPENEEPFDLTIEAGRGVTSGVTRAPIRLTARTLAALFTGWLDPHDAAHLGRIADASSPQLDLLSGALAGRPWLMDVF